MMQRESPPKHRHDGTSPLPLGMDWSPPPRKWKGRDTIWPHDPHTGWSYCVTIPSWVVRPKSRDSDPVVFYRVQIGLQSPEGITTTRGVLRRFNDFLKLFTVLKKAFPKKNLPPAPPKGLLRIKSRALLEERRCSLEDWMARLLSDIDLSRSFVVASFLELEAAARSSFQDEHQNASEASTSGNSTVSALQAHPNSSLSLFAGSASLTSDNGSDTAYETSEIGTPSLGRDNSSEGGTEDLSLDEDLTSPIEKLVKYGMSNIDEGLFMGHAILEQLEGLPRYKLRANNVSSINIVNGNASKAAYLDDSRIEHFSEAEHGKVNSHARKLSSESIGSDASSLRGSEISNSGFPNSFVEGSLEHIGGPEISRTMEVLGNTEFHSSDDVQLVLPLDKRYSMNKVLMTMQRRLVTAKTDMEDLISRLNQEIAVKDYLETKVKDLEVELETTKQRSKDNLHQAIIVERERVTQMQWDMEELRRKSLEMELKLKSQQDQKLGTASTNASVIGEKSALEELDVTKKQLEDVLKRHEELEIKSKADIKVLVKEVKSLRNSQAELKKGLSQSQKEKSDAERLLQLEKQCAEHAKAARQKLLHECGQLRNRLQECSIDFLAENGKELVVDSASVSHALDLLITFDNQIDHLIAEFAQDDDNVSIDELHKIDDETRALDDALRNMLKDIFTNNARLRKQVNEVLRCALKSDTSSQKDDDLSRRGALGTNTSVEKDDEGSLSRGHDLKTVTSSEKDDEGSLSEEAVHMSSLER
ncbi:PX domain-containing protein EREL1-like isoform X1 [Rhododendron vialii]|uniref:PX domain-containing protein EREL1-like isoform X1 n=1 Tax=Rhododendron vialii TaxID=182163 RepID=UPI00265EB163|nr:PX domain-containing protein EREL1-like isoform X1 [Rhododendron vialii]